MNSFDNHKKSTTELMELISSSRDTLEQLMEQLQSEQLNMTLPDFFNQILAQKQLTAAQVIQRSNLQAAYGHQILSGKKAHPSRNKLLALAFGMELTLEDTQQLLKIAHLPVLYPRIRQDLIIIFALKEAYSLSQVNEILLELNEEILA